MSLTLDFDESIHKNKWPFTVYLLNGGDTARLEFADAVFYLSYRDTVRPVLQIGVESKEDALPSAQALSPIPSKDDFPLYSEN